MLDGRAWRTKTQANVQEASRTIAFAVPVSRAHEKSV